MYDLFSVVMSFLMGVGVVLIFVVFTVLWLGTTPENRGALECFEWAGNLDQCRDLIKNNK